MLLSCRLHGHQVLLIPSLPSFRARRPWLVDGRVETSRAASAPGPGPPRATSAPGLGWAHRGTPTDASCGWHSTGPCRRCKSTSERRSCSCSCSPDPTLREPSLPAATFALSVRPGGRPDDVLTPKSPECPVTSVGEYYTGLLRRTKEAAHQTCFRRFTVVDARACTHAHTHPHTHTSTDTFRPHRTSTHSRLTRVSCAMVLRTYGVRVSFGLGDQQCCRQRAAFSVGFVLSQRNLRGTGRIFSVAHVWAACTPDVHTQLRVGDFIVEVSARLTAMPTDGACLLPAGPCPRSLAGARLSCGEGTVRRLPPPCLAHSLRPSMADWDRRWPGTHGVS